MTIRLVLSVIVLSSVSAWAQMGGLGSMRDPRATDSQGSSGAGAIQPWLAVDGVYDTYMEGRDSTLGSVRRSIGVSGGLSAARSFQRTSLVLGYSGMGMDYMGRSAGAREGWESSNVISLAVSSQVAHRLTLDFSEAGGAANGGFGAAAAGLSSGGLGVLGSVGLSSAFLFGGGTGLPGSSTGLNPADNGLVDADYYQNMTYFSSTSAGAGMLLTNRTMLNVSGTASFIRRDGSSYSDSNIAGANAMLSTRLSRRFGTFLGYSYTGMDFIHSIGKTYIQSGFAGIQYSLSPRDEFSVAVNDSYIDSKSVSTVTLPPDVAALLGVAVTTTVNNTSRTYVGGRLTYVHSFQRGGFDLSCNSMVAPGNDLILLSRSEGCTVTLSRSLTEHFSVAGLAGLRRLGGISQSGSRYDVANGGMVFSYRILRGLSLTAGVNYRATDVHPSSRSTSGVSANGGLYWTPNEGARLF